MYQCEFCTLQTKRKHNLKIHMLRKHKNQCSAQHGFNTEATQSIPIQEYNRVIEVANGWKNTCYKLKDFRGEDAQYFLEHITYLETLLNFNNINYEKYERY